MSRLRYLIGEAFSNLRRNALVVLGAVLAVFVSLIIAFAAVLFTEIVRVNTTRWEEGVRVLAFVSDELSVDAVGNLMDDVRDWAEVDDVVYFSKAEAFIEAKELFQDDPQLLELIEEDPTILPASLRVKPTTAEDTEFLVERLKATPGVIGVESAGPGIDGFIATKNVLTQASVMFSIMMAVAAIALIANTIRMAIYARRDEIGIMKLVGAGNWFVRVPFVLEGMIEGLIGGALALGAGLLGYRFLVNRLDSAPEWITVSVSADYLVQWGLVLLLGGVLVGMLGSGFALRRFLRE